MVAIIKQLFSYREVSIKQISDATNTTRKCSGIIIERSYVLSLFRAVQTI